MKINIPILIMATAMIMSVTIGYCLVHFFKQEIGCLFMGLSLISMPYYLNEVGYVVTANKLLKMNSVKV